MQLITFILGNLLYWRVHFDLEETLFVLQLLKSYTGKFLL